MPFRTLRPVLGLPAVLLASATIAAAPSAPPGWTQVSSGDIQVYRSEEAALSAELRLFPPQRISADLSAWFNGRLASPVPGVTAVRFDAATRLRSGALLATGTGIDAQGRRVYLIRMACSRPQGDTVYAESVASSDERFFRSIVPQTAGIFGNACFDATSDIAKGTPPAKAPTPAKPSPAAKAKAAEAPFAYARTPGTGLKQADVEAVLWSWSNETHGMGMRVVDYYYLLLKDGSYRDGLPPVPLEDFDAAASRAGEPDRWGRWTKAGSHYLLSGAAHPRRPEQKIEAKTVREPARPGERLEGTWEGTSAYATPWSVAQSRWSVHFDKSGRFVKTSGGSVVGGAGFGETAVHAQVVHDDDGSSASVGGSNFGGGSAHARASTLADRSGTYRLDGYTLELHYDSGRIVRLPFCAKPDRAAIWFEGNELDRAKPKGR